MTTNQSMNVMFFNNLLRTLKQLVLLTVMVAMLAGCVTTETGGLGSKADEKKALDYSLQLARNYIRESNWEAAKRHLKNALEIDDSSAEIYEALALVFQNTGELELAQENYKKSIRLDPKASRVRNNYAVFLFSQQKYPAAAEQLEVVVEDTLYRNRSSALANLGRCYIQLERWQDAEQVLRRAYLLDRGNPGLMFELAEVYFKLADFPKSQQFYDGYRNQVKQQLPQGLWLGIRLADKFDNRNAVSSYALALKNMYPTSKEYLEYKREFGNDH